MTALQLALTAKRLGARFEYRNGRIVATRLHELPNEIRQQCIDRLADLLAVVSEHNAPPGVRVTDVLDSARRIVSSVHA
jgi:hypothetical protein